MGPKSLKAEPMPVWQFCGIFAAYVLACAAVTTLMVFAKMNERLGGLSDMTGFCGFVAIVAAVVTGLFIFIGVRRDFELKRRLRPLVSAHPKTAFCIGVLVCFFANWTAAFLLIRDFPPDPSNLLEFFSVLWASLKGGMEGPVFMLWAAAVGTTINVIVGAVFYFIQGRSHYRTASA